MLFFDQLPDPLKAILEVWSVEFLVLIIFFFQSFLAFCGSSRRYNTTLRVRGLVWFAYLLSSKFPTVILGKLTTIPLKGNAVRIRSEILALLAPLILMLIGNPDAITAYSIQDNELGLRQIINVIIQIVIVIYIIVRSWTTSKSPYLYLPMFLAGSIKYGEAAWALKTALDKNSGLTINFYKQKDRLSSLLRELRGRGQDTEYVNDAKVILTAYWRFFQLKPHLENRLFQPLFESRDREFCISKLTSEEIFRVTDSELGFMYDILYTKAPIVYSRTGCVLRIISFLSLTGTLCGFIAGYQDLFVYDVGVGFVYFVLAASVIIETFQILLLPFSDWAIVMILRHYNPGGVLEKFLKFLAPQSKRWRRWSNSLEQFNLLDFCLNGRWAELSRWTIFQYHGMDMKLRKLGNTTRIAINSEVKELVVSEIKTIDEKRKQRPFVEVGEWTTDRYGIEDGDLIDKIFGASFDKCIITWHLATDICYRRHGPKTQRIEAIRMVSNYMMCFLARKPYILGAPTAFILFDHALERLQTLFKTCSLVQAEACEIIRGLNDAELRVSEGNRLSPETSVTAGWSLVRNVRDLVEKLESCQKKWELIGSAWIEMMCYAASKCEMGYHAEHLRRGGELITHVWLLLAHNTHKCRADPTSAV